MLIVKGIYDGNQVKLLETVNAKENQIVEVRFIEEGYSKARQLDAFQRARGIWKDRPEIDVIFREQRERWQQWNKKIRAANWARR